MSQTLSVRYMGISCLAGRHLAPTEIIDQTTQSSCTRLEIVFVSRGARVCVIGAAPYNLLTSIDR